MHKKKLLLFIVIEYPRNDPNIFNASMIVIRKFNYEDKNRSFTFDKAPIDNVLIDKLPPIS